MSCRITILDFCFFISTPAFFVVGRTVEQRLHLKHVPLLAGVHKDHVNMYSVFIALCCYCQQLEDVQNILLIIFSLMSGTFHCSSLCIIEWKKEITQRKVFFLKLWWFKLNYFYLKTLLSQNYFLCLVLSCVLPFENRLHTRNIFQPLNVFLS